ncbi:hypothetical protein SANTM175S_02228 [Streptomyces antimycoticus]
MIHHHGDHHQDITSALAPRQREVLAFLALQPNGARRETLTASLWPDAPADRPYNALHATLSQLRRALRTATQEALAEVIVRTDGPYTLDRDRVSVDLWELHDVLDATGPGHTNQHRLASVERLGDLYRGDLAEDLTAEWIEAPREALRRDILDAFGALAHTIDDTDPEQALILLEHARTLDRYNETLYQDIARLQAHLGQRDAVARTLALLTSTLAELEKDPAKKQFHCAGYFADAFLLPTIPVVGPTGVHRVHAGDWRFVRGVLTMGAPEIVMLVRDESVDEQLRWRCAHGRSKPAETHWILPSWRG